jgi:phosphoribosylformimino-5-aminoimidazole carboxamide ribotide isomerase
MYVLPVLDLLNGVVVRGVAGRRNEYHPVVSRLSDNCDILSVARGFRQHLGLTRLYVADLDGILHQRPNWESYRIVAADGFELWIDAGLRDVATAGRVFDAGASKAIVGLETWPGPNELAQLCRLQGSDKVTFSLDLLQGAAMGNLDSWGSADPFEIGCRAVEAGVRELIVLDIAQVGMGEGVTTISLCQRLLMRFPGLRLITGGGVRNSEDLRRLEKSQVDAVLVASALHDGRIAAEEIGKLAGGTYSNFA